MAGKQDTKPEAVITILTLPTPLPSKSHLKGAQNYDVWCIQLQGLIGQDAYRVMIGETARGKGGLKEETWDRLDGFVVSPISISCHASVIHHVSDCDYNAYAYWSALRSAFRPTNAQGALCLLTQFWSLTLSAASPESFDTFAKEYEATIGALKTAKIDLETVYASHLLNALPSLLNLLQTTLAVSNQSTLPRIDTILELARNEILRTSTSSSSLALVTSSSSSPCDRNGPPPSSCPAFGQYHWLAQCLKRDQYQSCKDQKGGAARIAIANPPPSASGNFALVDSLKGVKAWLPSSSLSTDSLNLYLTHNSGATHPMWRDREKLSNFWACTPLAVGGIVAGPDETASGLQV